MLYLCLKLLLNLQGDPIGWVSIHRYHHQFTDLDQDPHSPIKGFWFSHFTWLIDTEPTAKRVIFTTHCF